MPKKRSCKPDEVGYYWNEWLMKKDLDTDAYWDEAEAGGVEELDSIYHANINNAESYLEAVMKEVEHCSNPKQVTAQWRKDIEKEIRWGKLETKLSKLKSKKACEKTGGNWNSKYKFCSSR